MVTPARTTPDVDLVPFWDVAEAPRLLADFKAARVAPGTSAIGSSSESVTVWNAEASAGVTYTFGKVSGTLGYRVDAFWDLYDGDLIGFDGDSNRIVHGPFAKLNIYLSGGDH